MNKESQNSENRFKLMLSLFWTFFKIGAFTFGGGYAMIPLIQLDLFMAKRYNTK